MKKFVALVVLVCAVMISSTTSAATMANWIFVKNVTLTAPYVPKYTKTPEQYYEDSRLLWFAKTGSASRSKRLAEQDARQYEADYEAEQIRLQTPLTYKLSSYIDTNSVVAEQTADNGVAFCVLMKEVYSPSAGIYWAEYLKDNKKPVPEGLETLSFIVQKIHFKSPDGITKYYATSDSVAFTSSGTQIKDLALSNAPLKWTFINPESNLEAVFDAAYKLLR